MRRVLVATVALALAVGLGASPSLAGRSRPATEPAAFPYGVGANDIGATTASIWTQTTATRIFAMLSTDPGFASNVRRRRVSVSSMHDGTALVPFKSLTPATTYYYKFQDPVSFTESRVGTFQTAPDPASDVDVTFAYSGDQDGTIDQTTGRPCFNNFESFPTIQGLGPQFYVNLGDTIYADSKCLETPNTTLDEYRGNYKQNLSYDGLRDLRAAIPFLTVWDDHEVQNDFDAETVDPTLLANGTQAFEEYDGVRANPNPALGFYRHFRWGQEAEVFVLDERSFRTAEALRMDVDGNGIEDCQNSETLQADLAPTLSQFWRDHFASQIPGSGLDQPVPPQCTADLEAEGRTMLGDAQRTQFETDLAASTAKFKLVVNEDPIQQFFALPYDRWERNQILQFVDDNDIANVVWLTTDVHAYLSHAVSYNSADPGVGTQVEGMVDYTVGPIATDTFRQEINDLLGDDTATQVRSFLLLINKNTCANLGAAPPNPGAPYYGFGLVHIDAATHTLTITPIDHTGTHIAGNGGSGGRDSACYDYVATAP